MQTKPAVECSEPAAPLVQEQEPSAPGQILEKVFDTFNREGIRYCVMHGYDGYPHRVGSDVDCIVEKGTSPELLHSVLQRNSSRIGAVVVRKQGYHFVLAGKNEDGFPIFLTLDLATANNIDGMQFHASDEALASRQRYRQFWIPAPAVEFGCYLVRCIALARLDEIRVRRLSRLFLQNNLGCREQIDRFWDAQSAELIVTAARTNNWETVRQNLDHIRSELRRRAVLRNPTQYVLNRLQGVNRRLGRLWRPDGLTVAVLGPDGAGKSSLIEAVGLRLLGPFSRATCSGFAPSPRELFRRGLHSTSQPHGLPSRSLPVSLLRAAYWLVYHLADTFRVRVAMARSTLMFYDRQFIDILVDQRRYRYGGPVWLLHMIGNILPKPDIVIGLDAPTEIMQARKQELSCEETSRQRVAYTSLVKGLVNGVILDASKPSGQVARDVCDLIIAHLVDRIAHRWRLDEDGQFMPGHRVSTRPEDKPPYTSATST